MFICSSCCKAGRSALTRDRKRIDRDKLQSCNVSDNYAVFSARTLEIAAATWREFSPLKARDVVRGLAA
jgi:hypothetical protein